MGARLVFVVGIAAALSLGVGYVVQQRVAAHARLSELLSFRLLWFLMHKPVWWAGIGAMIAGQLLGGLALQLASVGLVEPLLSANLLFALAIASYLSDHRIHWYEIGGAVLLSASLGVFIAVGDPQSDDGASADLALIMLACGIVLAVVTALIAVGKRRGLVGESILLSTGAGLLYGLQDVSTRGVLVNLDHHGLLSTVLSPWPYVVVGAAVFGILLSQSAFRAARLDYSLPPIAAAEPIAGIALGVVLLGDTMSVTVPGLTVIAACLLAMLVAVAMIGRSPSLAGHHLHLRHLAAHPAAAQRQLSPAPGKPADSP